MYRMPGKQTTAIWTALEVLLLSVCKSPTLSLTFHQTQISWLFFTTFRFASFHFILFLCKLYSFMWIYAFKWKKTSKKRCVYNHGDSYLLRFTHTSMRVKDGMTRLRDGMRHGFRTDVIMRNLIYGKWRKEKSLNRKACARLCRAFFWRQFDRAMDLPVPLLLLLKQD